MSKPVKIIAGVLTIVLIFAAVTGIAVWSANTSEKPVEPGLLVNGKLEADPGTVMKVGDHEISFADYRHYYLSSKTFMEMMYGETIWQNDIDHGAELMLRENTDDTIKRLYAWQDIAAEMNVTLTDEEKAAVVDALSEMKESQGENFATALFNEHFVDEEQYIRIHEMEKLQEKTQEALQAKLTEENEAAIRDSIVSAQHILIQPLEEAKLPAGDESAASDASLPADASADASAPADASVPADASTPADASVPADSSVPELEIEPVDGEDDLDLSMEEEEELTPEQESERMAQAKIVADELVRLIREADDPKAKFAELRAEYDTDGGQPEEGYTFGEGEMVDEFYQGALALNEGDISDPIQTSYGYHIILRQPVADGYVDENLESLMSGKLSELEEEKVTAVLDDLPVVNSEIYDAIKPTTIQ